MLFSTIADRRLFRIGTGVAALIALMSLPLPFFWDSILLGSEVGQHFLAEGLDAWILPNALDSGHPPGFGWYLALWWTALGPTLPVAHLAMFPVLVMIWWNFYRLLLTLLPGPSLEASRALAAGLLILEPTFAAQAIHIGPDLMLLAFYLGALNAIINRRPWILTLLLIGMGMVSLRGCFGVASLWFTALILERHGAFLTASGAAHHGKNIRNSRHSSHTRQPVKDRKHAGSSSRIFNKFTLIPFVAATAVITGWLCWHALKTGWFLVNPQSAWSSSHGFAGITGMLRNLGLVAWRVLDFGRLVLWVPGLAWFILWWKNRKSDLPEFRLILVFAVPLLTFTVALLPFSNPIAHRYFLMVFVLALPWFAFRICQLEISRRQFFLIMVVAMLGFGHRWIYPDKIAKGWDASLAHLPYFSLMSKAWAEIPEPGLVYTEFPLYKPMQSIRPGSSQQRESFQKVPGNWLDCDYVLYSNIINDIPDEAYDEITGKWPLQREWSQGRVFIRLYRKPGMVPIELPEMPEEQ